MLTATPTPQEVDPFYRMTRDEDDHARHHQALDAAVTALNAGGGGGGTPPAGVDSPEGAVTAPPGTHYWQTDAGDWVKNSGSGNTGWIQQTFLT